MDSASLARVSAAGDRLASEFRSRELGFAALKRIASDVEDFIRARQLVVYGGQAIDFALRARGADGIYAADTLPDYDFLSPDHAGDAFVLAQQLAAKHPPHRFSVRRARHIQTVRIWCNSLSSEPVADLSFMPPSVFERVPFLELDGIRFVHPRWQFADQHLSLSRPFGRFPGENVFFRWRKEVPRHCLLFGMYPPPAAFDSAGGGDSLERVTIPAALFDGPFLLAGMSAVAALAASFPQLAAVHPVLALMGESFAVDGEGNISHKVPAWHRQPGSNFDGPHSDAIFPGFSAAGAKSRLPAETESFRGVMDVGWPHVVALCGAHICRVENSAGSLVPYESLQFGKRSVRVAGCQVVLKQLSFWAAMRGEPRADESPYWPFYSAVHSCVSTFSASAPEQTEEQRYWTLLAGLSAGALLGAEEVEPSDEYNIRQLGERRSGAPDPLLKTVPPNFTPAADGSNAPPAFVPSGQWFTLDGSRE